MSAEPDPSQQGVPGNRVKKLAKRSRVLRSILDHTHALQIVDDHQKMWLEATSEEERERIKSRLNRQLARASVNFVGLHVTVHGVIGVIAADPLHSAFFAIAGIAVMYATSGKG